MKILQVNCVYNKGSTGKITYDLHQGLLKAGMESVVCYGRGALVREPHVYKTCPEWYSKLNNLLTRLTGIMYGGCYFSTNRLISIIKREKPDIVHLQCINGYFVNIYRLITWLKRQRIKTVLTLHAEFMYTANCGHAMDCGKWRTGCGHCPRRRQETKSLFVDGTAVSWKRMKKAFESFEKLLVVSVSPWLMERAAQSAALADKKHCVIYNGLDTDVFHVYDTKAMRQKYHCEDRKVVFHATPAFNADPNHIKGGYYVLELAKLLPEMQFIVAGSCTERITAPENVAFLGRIEDQSLLAQYYSMADVTLLTSKRETFSMICAESLCCGTPVVGFKAGAPEQISLAEYSEFVEPEDLSMLRNAVMRVCNQTWQKECVAEDAARVYAKQTMIREYVEAYNAWT